jgi:hypothetical protein
MPAESFRSTMTNASDDDIRGWVQSEMLDEIADYAARGRKHRDMSSEDLSAAWVNSFQNVARDLTSPQFWSIQIDLIAEYGLRNEQPPYHHVAEDMCGMVTDMKKLVNEIRAGDDGELLGENITSGET